MSIQLIYVLMGLVLIVVNAPVVLTVLKHQILRQRKEYIIFAGIALVDLLAGLATLQAGVYRLVILGSDLDQGTIGRHHCALLPHTILFLFVSPLQAITMLVVSLDRLFVVSFSLQYFQLNASYSLAMHTGGYVLSAIVALGTFVPLASASPLEDDVDPFCVAFALIDRRSFRAVFYLRLAFACLAIVVYAFVPLVHYTRTKQMAGRNSNDQANRIYGRRQRALTMTVGITCSFTLCFYIAPLVANLIIGTAADHPTLAVCLWLMNCANSLLQVGTYTFRHHDMRASVVYFLTCRELPTNFLDQNRQLRSAFSDLRASGLRAKRPIRSRSEMNLMSYSKELTCERVQQPQCLTPLQLTQHFTRSLKKSKSVR